MLHPRHARPLAQAVEKAQGRFAEITVEDALAACDAAGDCPAASKLRAGCQGVTLTRGTSTGAPARRIWVLLEVVKAVLEVIQKTGTPNG